MNFICKTKEAFKLKPIFKLLSLLYVDLFVYVDNEGIRFFKQDDPQAPTVSAFILFLPRRNFEYFELLKEKGGGTSEGRFIKFNLKTNELHKCFNKITKEDFLIIEGRVGDIKLKIISGKALKCSERFIDKNFTQNEDFPMIKEHKIQPAIINATNLKTACKVLSDLGIPVSVALGKQHLLIYTHLYGTPPEKAIFTTIYNLGKSFDSKPYIDPIICEKHFEYEKFKRTCENLGGNDTKVRVSIEKGSKFIEFGIDILNLGRMRLYLQEFTD
jgi:hypothetical protein